MSLLVKDDFQHLGIPTQVDFFSDSPINYALTAVAQEVAGLLQQAYPVQSDSINHARTIIIRAIKPEYRQIISHVRGNARSGNWTVHQSL